MLLRIILRAVPLMLAALAIGCGEAPPQANSANVNRNSNANVSYNTNATGNVSTNANATPPPPVSDDDIDAYVASLPLGEASFNTPERMLLNESINVDLKLGGPKLVGQTAPLVRGEGKVETHRIKVSRVMEAQLAGANFEIIPIPPMEQPVSENVVTEWVWQVRATGEGKQRLYLTLTAVFTLDGTERRLKAKTFQKEITVEVKAGRRAREFFFNNVGWIVPVLILPLAGALFVRLRKLFRRDDHLPPAT